MFMDPAFAGTTGALEPALAPYYIPNTARSPVMDFIRRMQPKDWTIAIVAFVAGAFIF